MSVSSISAVLLLVAVTLALAGCVAAWSWLIANVRAGTSVVACQPRRPVPWRLVDVVFIAIVYLLAPSAVAQTVRVWIYTPAEAAPPRKPASSLDMEHPIARVLLESNSGFALLVCVASAAVIAPLTEELLFRLLLQGWLESVERRLGRRFRWLRRMAGLLPILLVSLLFASLHIRFPGPPEDISSTIFALTAYAVGSVITVTFLIGWLKFAVGATAADFGIVPSRLRDDVKLGLIAFVACLAPVYVILVTAKTLLPGSVVADPIPLFLLALVLGGLYYRTHRIVPSIVLHVGINATAVFIALAFQR